MTTSPLPLSDSPGSIKDPDNKRNHIFQTEREPFRQRSDLQIRHSKANGPVNALNPTSVHFHFNPDAPTTTGLDRAKHSSDSGSCLGGKPVTGVPGINYKWTSRNNRKGRHALAVDPNVAQHGHDLPPRSSSPRTILKGIGRMFTQYPIWDVSYLVATVFTLGSVVWVINAFFDYLPYVQPSTDFATETGYGGGITAFIGATIFEFGSFLLMAEAINENRTGCFGWAVEQLEAGLREKGGSGIRLRPADCTHHHPNKRNLVGKPADQSSEKQAVVSANSSNNSPSWVWWPGWHELRTHYFHEIGFLACLSQLFGATIFWISGFTALPGIYNVMSPGLIDGIYWTPQVVGGLGFVVSGTLFMIETQPKWYIPAPKVLGWHIGLWNLIGGVGFTLCPCFGYDTASWAEYQSSLSTFWGSWAFLIGSVIQWYESLDKHPVQSENLGDAA